MKQGKSGTGCLTTMSISSIRIAVVACLVGLVGVSLAQEKNPLRPLDKRTKCLIQFREALLLTSKNDVQGVLARVADGGPSNHFKVFPDGKVSAGLKREAENPETFFKHNFPRSEEILGEFDGILISELEESPETATVTDDSGQAKQDAKVYVMDVQIPGITDAAYSELRFVEVGRKIFWVPFGW